MKKFKLFVSITLLCLTIANLCAGVLAIQNITYLISGTINYKIEDIYAQITTKIYKRQEQRTSQELQTDAIQLSSMLLSDITYTLSQDKGTYNSFTNSGTSSAKDIDITFGAGADGKIYYTYYIVVNIQNLSTVDNMYAVLEDNNTDDGTVCKYCIYTQDKILKGSKNRNIIIAYSVSNTLKDVSLSFSYDVSVKMGTMPTVTNTLKFDANGGFLPSLIYDTDDVGSSTSYAGQGGAGYYIQNGEIYVNSLTENSNDCYVHTKIKIDMTAGKKYIMKFDGQSLNDISTTIGVGLFLNNAYNYFIFKDPVQTPKKNTPKEVTVTFEPTTTGTYYLRIDSNMSGAKIKISNLRIYEDGTEDMGVRNVSIGESYGGKNIYPYSSYADANGWYNYSNISNSGTSTSYPGTNMFTKYDSSIVADKTYLAVLEVKNCVQNGANLSFESAGRADSSYGTGQFKVVNNGKYSLTNGVYYLTLKSLDISSNNTKFFLRTHMTLSAGGKISSLSLRISVYEDVMPVPTKSGKTFDGWWTAKNGGTQITSSSMVSSSTNQTLYAHWK